MGSSSDPQRLKVGVDRAAWAIWMLLTRRAFVSGLAAFVASGEVHARRSTAGPEPGPTDGFSVLEVEFASAHRWTRRARVYVPQHAPPGDSWPVAILLHGYGQALNEQRALAAWRKEYDVLSAYTRLRSGRVQATPSLGETRARQISEQLEARPFGGMVLVAPVTPIPYFQRNLSRTLRVYARWIHEQLLPRVSRLVPVSTAPEQVGLAGFSMGGLVGLELMCRYPELFGAYCGIQIALEKGTVPRYAWLLDRALNKLGDATSRPIGVVTATLDTYRRSNVALYQALSYYDLNASLELRKGSHSARWMRQAGSLEGLLWLDQRLNGSLPKAAPPSPSTTGTTRPPQRGTAARSSLAPRVADAES
jgi:enterochelin esterase-like enzyme